MSISTSRSARSTPPSAAASSCFIDTSAGSTEITYTASISGSRSIASPMGVLFTTPPSTQGPTPCRMTGSNANGNAADAAAAWNIRSRLSSSSRSAPSNRSTCSNVVLFGSTPASGVTTIRRETGAAGGDAGPGHSVLRRSTIRSVPESPRLCAQPARSGSTIRHTLAFSSQSRVSFRAASTGTPARTPAAIMVALSAPELVPTSRRIGVPSSLSLSVRTARAPAAKAPFATAPPMTIAAPRPMPPSTPKVRTDQR